MLSCFVYAILQFQVFVVIGLYGTFLSMLSNERKQILNPIEEN